MIGKILGVLALLAVVAIASYDSGTGNATTRFSTTTKTYTVTSSYTQQANSSSTAKSYRVTAQFTILGGATVQYFIYENGVNTQNGQINLNASIPIQIGQRGNVTVSTLIDSYYHGSVEVVLYENGSTIAVGYNGVGQRDNVTGFVG